MSARPRRDGTKAISINQQLIDGKVYPTAPASIAAPIGWLLNDEGIFVREIERQPSRAAA